MILYKLKYILKSFLKQKSITAINITGLAIAITALFLIAVYLKTELSYDTHFSNSKRVSRFTLEFNQNGYTSHFARVNNSVIQHIPNDFPEVERMVRISPFRQASVKASGHNFYTEGAFMTDSNFFEVFNIPLLEGDSQNILNAKGEAVISQSIRELYFGNKNAIGESIELCHQHTDIFMKFTIVGVMPDFPMQSHFHPQVLVSYEDPNNFSMWNYVYLLFHENIEMESINAKFPDFIEKHLGKENAELLTCHLQNVEDIHLHSHKDRELEINGNIKNVYILMVLAFLILIVVLLNFSNLNVVSLVQRRKSLWLTQISGANFRSIVEMEWMRNFIILSFAAILGFVLSVFLVEPFYLYFDLPKAENNLLFSPVVAWVLFGMVILGSFVGTLPLFLRKVIDKAVSPEKSDNYFRNKSKSAKGRIPIISQFVVVIFLLVAVFTINKQMKLLMHSQLGGQNNNIINLYNLPRQVIDKYDILKSELSKISGITEVTGQMEEPSGEIMDAINYNLGGITKDEFSDKRIYIFSCDYNFLDFYDIDMVAGQSFDADTSKHWYVINESAIEYLGLKSAEDAIGRTFELDFFVPGFLQKGIISGVCKDIHLTSMVNKEKPTVFFHKNYWNFCVSIRFEPEALTTTIAEIEKTWTKLFPEFAFEYYFIDDFYIKSYKQFINQGKFLTILSILAILIASLGLFAVAGFAINQRIKEIGLRKVNGAKKSDILIMINSEFLKWILIAFVISCPLTWYATNKWLENFAYRTEINFWIFVIAGLLATIAALSTISWQTWWAARQNPVRTLRYE